MNPYAGLFILLGVASTAYLVGYLHGAVMTAKVIRAQRKEAEAALAAAVAMEEAENTPSNAVMIDGVQTVIVGGREDVNPPPWLTRWN